MSLCSIVIPTYRRPDFIRRALEYYRRQSGDMVIIIADGGNDELRARNAATIAEYRDAGLPVHQLVTHEPPSFAGQILSGMEAVDTPYAVYMSDDDFISYSFIDAAIQHLQNNPSCHSVCGQRVQFSIAENSVYGTMVNPVLHSPPEHREKTAAQRILAMEERHFAGQQTYNLLEAVRSTEDWLTIARAKVSCRDLDHDWPSKGYTLLNTFIDELLTTHLTLAQGQLHVVQGLNVGINAHAEQNGIAVFDGVDASTVFADPLWPVSWAAYRTYVVDAIMAADDIDAPTATKVVDFAAWRRMSHFLAKGLNNRAHQLYSIGLTGWDAPQSTMAKLESRYINRRRKIRRRAMVQTLSDRDFECNPELTLLRDVVQSAPSSH